MLSIYKHIFKRDELCDEGFVNDPFFRIWMLRALSQFETTVDDKDFPCLFGKKAIKLKKFFLFFSNINRPFDDLVNGVREYTEMVKSIPVNERIYSPLVLFFEKNSFQTLEDEHNYAWSILQELHDRDTTPWPDNISLNTDTENWSFCFNGVPLFINMSCPKHVMMKSRNLGDYIVLVINPRENFDVIASADSKNGKSLREKIRARIRNYNNGVMPTTLGFYGEKDNFEWKQYQLEECGGLELSECPLHIRK